MKIDRYASYGIRCAIAIFPTDRSFYERGIAPPGLTLDIDAICEG